MDYISNENRNTIINRITSVPEIGMSLSKAIHALFFNVNGNWFKFYKNCFLFPQKILSFYFIL